MHGFSGEHTINTIYVFVKQREEETGRIKNVEIHFQFILSYGPKDMDLSTTERSLGEKVSP